MESLPGLLREPAALLEDDVGHCRWHRPNHTGANGFISVHPKYTEYSSISVNMAACIHQQHKSPD